MSTVTITGKFKNSENNNIVLDVYSPNPGGFEFKKDYPSSFTKTFDDLHPGTTYYADFVGHTTGTFDIVIDGDVESKVSASKSGFFIDGLTFKTK